MTVNSSELIRMVVDAVADDYEEFDMIFHEVSKWINNPTLTPDAVQIQDALMKSVAEKDIQAFEYSESSARFLPAEVGSANIRKLWFHITDQGKQKLLQPTIEYSLTREPIPSAKIVAAAKSGEDGAVVVFDGIVRNHSRGRPTLHLDYEAYEEMALKQMRELGVKARERFGVRHITIVHRLGRLEIGETSVLIVVASAHRSAAFEASRWLIDSLKQTVPIWKKETFADGVVWAPGEPFPDALVADAAEAPHEI
ncbi:MAG TPA: molybdenum cofactor biosynthesis protein MoaE [Candidatus Sulfotelmatobacter sp.]|jgi:molybdopterin synthase catalytic subunit